MSTRLAPHLPRIAQFLLVALDRASADGERVNAMHAIDSALQNASADKYELIERIKTPPLTQEDLQKVFDAGYNKRISDEAELRSRVVAVMARPKAAPRTASTATAGRKSRVTAH